ncbi:MAG TPA: sigma-E processing peptidase SpoIIGA [Tissierellaceae bacterium]|nr:sigma-E processing peptidase SpoIIGA [Tissierellaceae bacterium]
MYIILEYYLLENFIINFLILYLTKLITKSTTLIRNIILGGIISALYSLVFFYPSLLFLTKFYMKIIISIIIVLFTFKSDNLKIFIYQLIGFYIMSFIFAGAIMGISFNFGNVYHVLIKKIQVQELFKLKYILIGLFIAILGAYKIFEYYDNRSIQEKFLATATISYNNKNISIEVLVDTGNTLVEPFSNRSVMVAEYDKLKDFLPIELRKVYDNNNCNDFIILEKTLKELRDDISLHLIPFESVGNSGGILLGFRPDYIIIDFNDEESILEENMIVGIFQGKISEDLNYSGLLNYKVISQGELA